MHGVEVAPGAEHGIIKSNGVKHAVWGKHGLDGGRLGFAIDVENLTPDELHANLPLQNWLQSERKAIKMSWFHKRTKHTRRVFKEFFCIHNGDMKVLLQVLC